MQEEIFKVETPENMKQYILRSHERLAMGWTVRGSKPSRGKIFRTCPDRPWGPTSLVYNGYQVFFTVGPSWAVKRWPLPFYIIMRSLTQLFIKYFVNLQFFSYMFRLFRAIFRLNFRTRQDHPWGPPSLLYNGYRVFPGGKAAGAWRWPPTLQLAPRLKKE